LDTLLYKLLSKDKQARIFLIDNTAVLNALEEKYFMSFAASDVFFSAITFCCQLHGIMTNAKRISVKLETSNPSAFLICGADANGSIQAYASDDFRQESYADLSSMIGSDGCLKIIQDNGFGTLFTGIVEIKENSIVNNLAHYFLQSEQTNTIFRYFREIQDAKVLLSRGVLIQALPFADNSMMSQWENRIDSYASLFADPSTLIEDILKTVFSDSDVLDRYAVRFMCTCSKDTILEMLLGLGINDLEWTLNDNRNIEVRCNKCGKRYSFDADEIRCLLL